jgi:hypothetical protein
MNFSEKISKESQSDLLKTLQGISRGLRDLAENRTLSESRFKKNIKKHILKSKTAL